ncbi:hypothetical protein ElyMa_004291900 [Elysia marginata]|uniref:Uncharacterized protein n=1 Tax=Elysia marginata TaxID=1093978 RepID=A0AAV4GVI4_9GAST|nr:hypothetical protein ElyMa_004291900 [Elysia marginata]
MRSQSPGMGSGGHARCHNQPSGSSQHPPSDFQPEAREHRTHGLLKGYQLASGIPRLPKMSSRCRVQEQAVLITDD